MKKKMLKKHQKHSSDWSGFLKLKVLKIVQMSEDYFLQEMMTELFLVLKYIYNNSPAAAINL